MMLRPRPTLAEVRAAAAALRRHTAEGNRVAWAELYAKELRDPWWVRPRYFEAELAEFLERAFSKRSKPGRPSPDWRSKVDTAIASRVVNARVARWRRALSGRKHPAPMREALRRVSAETGLGEARLRKCWRERDGKRHENPPK
jgi:hypothetical protein